MRKKYLSALLFGALLFASAGTFTSCKDYDDDINNLQSQIDKLATKEDMEAKLSQMETAINDAKATAEKALKAAQEAGSADEIAKLEARIKALEDAALDVDALKKEIADSVEEQMADFREEMEELLKKVEELTGYSFNMVTGISFVEENGYSSNLDLNYARVSKVFYPEGLLQKNNGNLKSADSYVFGGDFAGAFTVKSGDVNTVVDQMLVKLDPVNSVITDDMLSIVDAEGQNLNEYLNISTEAYSDQIVTSRGASTTGLHLVNVQLKNTVNFEEFGKRVIAYGHKHQTGACYETKGFIAHALSVSESYEDMSRKTISDYDVTMHVLEEDIARNIDLKTTIESSAMSSNDPSYIGWYDWANDNPDGIRDGYPCPIKLGEAFTLKVASEGGKVMASYVEVDINNSNLSATDRIAINTLTFKGVKEVSKSLKHEITVSGNAAIPVPMKLVTIDYTGRVQAFVFWVKASTPAECTANFVVTPKTYVADATKWNVTNPSGSDFQEFTIPAKATQYSIDFIVGEGANATSYNESRYWNYTELSKILELQKADGTVATKPEDVAKVAFIGSMNLNAMREDKTYEGVIRFYDANDTYLGYNTITVTKKLPTKVPASFSAKTNAINNGVLTIYPTANADKTGTFALDNAFNGLYTESAGVKIYDNHYSLVLADVNAGFNANTQTLTAIPSAVINSGVAYEATYTYNYGDIKFKPVGHGTQTPDNCVVTWSTKFAVKFGCLPYDATYTWSNGAPKVYYKESVTIKGKTADKSDFINVVDPYKKTIDPFRGGAADQLSWTDYAEYLSETTPIKLITGDGKVNEFFTAKFVKNANNFYNLELTVVESTNVVLSGDVNTKVVITITDKFGHPHDIELLEFTMLKSH